MPAKIIRILMLSIIGMMLLVPGIKAGKSNRVYYTDQVAVLMYHHVDDEAQSSGTITTKLFEDQLTHLKNEGFQFLTLQEFKDYLLGATVPNNAVFITFDDGYASFYNKAYPILKNMRIPAVNFAITGDVENPGSSYIPSFTKDNIIEMTHDTNFIDIQCHTHKLHFKQPDGKAALIDRFDLDNHKETEEEYSKRVASDTQACVQSLSKLYPGPIDTFAYPFGIFDKQASGLIESVGIKLAFTVFPGMATRDVKRMEIPRINAGNPKISPEGLEQSIMRRVLAVHPQVRDVDLKEAVEQLGGQVTIENRRASIQFEGKTIHLQKKLRLKNGNYIISIEDLQQALGIQFSYNPNNGQFNPRVIPTVVK